MTEQNRPHDGDGTEDTTRIPVSPSSGDTAPPAQPSIPPPPAPAPPPSWQGDYGQPSRHGPEQTAAFAFGDAFHEEPAPTPREPRRRRGRGVGLLLGALVLGTAGGVAGAAGYDRLNDDTTASSGSNTGSTVRSTVNDTPDTPAADGSAEAVAAQVLPSVVKINVSGAEGQGSGSGIILSSDGEILTNDHVVEVVGDSGEMTVAFNDGSLAKATVVGTDPVTDLAVIKAEGVSGLAPATLGSSDNLDVGEGVLAIGSPFGLQATVTSGIVSALNRPVTVGATSSGTDTTYPAIQTDAAINPGNSGGPLVNMAGEVVGINSSIRTSSSGLGTDEGGSIGLGFAIPIDKALPIADQLRNGDKPSHARLGVTVQNASGDSLVTGATIREITSGSAGDKAGLEPGDIVTRVNEDPIVSTESLVATIRGYRPGDTVTLTVQRGEETLTLEATLDSDLDAT